MSIQSLEYSKCASASSSGFPENSGIKFDQFYMSLLLPYCILMLMLFLSLSLVGCSCSFFSIFHFSYLQFSYPYMVCILFFFLLSIPDVIILMLSNFNSSQMLEFDDFWKLLATSLLQVLSQMKNLFPNFFSLFLVLGGFFLLLIMAF